MDSILLGNGIHRIYSDKFDWGKILNRVKKEALDDDEQEDVPYVHQFEDIVFNHKYDEKHIEKFVSDGHDKDIIKSNTNEWYVYQVAKYVKQAICCEMNEVYSDVEISSKDSLFQELTNLPIEHFMTTNYDRALDDSLKNSTEKAKDNTEQLYSLRRYYTYTSEEGEKTIWPIHGRYENEDSVSVILGYSQYCGYLRKIINYIQKGAWKSEKNPVTGTKKVIKVDSSFDSSKEKTDYMVYKLRKNDNRINTWVDLFFFSNVHIVGFNMDISEIDLWEVLNKRKSYMASIKLHDPRFKDVVINNKIFFYGINGKEDGMCNLLKDYDVEFVPINPSSEGEGLWKNGMKSKIEEIKNNISNEN